MGGKILTGERNGVCCERGKEKEGGKEGKIMTERKTCEGGVVIRVTSIN